jgi:translation initiation factor 2 alpha subunit (eIF-2alpha)
MENEFLTEGQLVLCTVEKIVGTTVFVKIENCSLDGSITFPEIAPGRIRNIRDFVVPQKKIVCKVLAKKQGIIELSLRRVKPTEKTEFNNLYKKEKSYIAMLKTILGEKSEAIIKEIKLKENIIELFNNAQESSEKLEKYLGKDYSSKIIQILSEKKQKEVYVTRRIGLSNKSENGIEIIREVLKEAINGCNCEASYIAAGKYLLKIKAENLKSADSQIEKIIEKIEMLSKKKSCYYNKII